MACRLYSQQLNVTLGAALANPAAWEDYPGGTPWCLHRGSSGTIWHPELRSQQPETNGPMTQRLNGLRYRICVFSFARSCPWENSRLIVGYENIGLIMVDSTPWSPWWKLGCPFILELDPYQHTNDLPFAETIPRVGLLQRCPTSLLWMEEILPLFHSYQNMYQLVQFFHSQDVKHVPRNPLVRPHSNTTSKQYDILITEGWMKTQWFWL